MYHLEAHGFGLCHILIVGLCGIMRVEEFSQIRRAPGDPIELLACALLKANNRLLPYVLDGRGRTFLLGLYSRRVLRNTEMRAFPG